MNSTAYSPETLLDRKRLCGWLNSRMVDKTASYLRQGRSFGNTESGALKERWVVRFREWAQDLNNDAAREQHEFIQAELSLRNDFPPYDQAQEEIGMFIKQVMQRVQGLGRDEQGAVQNSLLESIEAFYKRAGGEVN